ncbi:MAG TPA: hypothetical protein VMX58_11350 [Patescibacteria group bacterium]|nr:hypothetical protein [Patescibacteria group bacterium]
MRDHNTYTMRAVSLALILVICAAHLVSCGKEREEPPAEDLTLDEELYGFHLGERLEHLREISQYRLEWEKLPEPRMGYRGEQYRLSGTLDGSHDIDHVRASFFDGYLWELIVYFRDTGYSTLRNTQRRLEQEYGVRPTSPDGAIEKTYKTYHFDLPEMSVTLCRFTKKPSDELYIQYMHKELHRRLLERNKEE